MNNNNNVNLSSDQINLMNSILDRELDSLKNSYSGHNESNPKDRVLYKENINFSQNVFTEKNNLNLTRIGNKSMDVSIEPTKSSKMQDDLIELQNKLLTLERKIVNINSPLKSNDTVASISPFRNKSPNQKEKNLGIRDSENEDSSPMKSKFSSPTIFSISQNSELSKRGKNYDYPIKEVDKNLKNSENVEERARNRKKRRSPSEKKTRSKSNKKLNKVILEQTISALQSELETSKTYLKRSSLSRSRDSSRGSAKPRTPVSGRKSAKGIGNELDINKLNKKLSNLRKQYEEDQGALIKERIKNQELMVQIEKMEKRIKKMQIDMEKFSRINTDYNRLMESFEKSEFIRQQQKQLISSLNKEIEQLKKEKAKKSQKMLESEKPEKLRQKVERNKSKNPIKKL